MGKVEESTEILDLVVLVVLEQLSGFLFIYFYYFSEYFSESNLYDFDFSASIETINPIIPAIKNINAIPLPTPTPNHPPIKCTPAPVVIKGINTNSASGAIKKATNGETDCSIV